MAALAMAGSLLLAEGRYPDVFQKFRAYLEPGVESLHLVVSVPGALWGWLNDQSHREHYLRRELAALQAARLQDAVSLQKLAELSAENARLRGLLDSSLVTEGRMLMAEVVRADPDPDRQVVTLDKGRGDDLRVGLPVLDARGIMGQVIEVGAFRSQVMLISDRRHGIAVRVARSGARGILQGVGDGSRLDLRYLPESADIVQGDLLLSSGLGTRFPAGYPVAVVSKVFRSGGGEFADVQARPVAELGSSRHVMVLFTTTQDKAGQAEAADADLSREALDAQP